MSSDISYTTEEIAKMLKISKLTVYDLIKKESFRPTASANRCAWTRRISKLTSSGPKASERRPSPSKRPTAFPFPPRKP